jgi:PAS domain S-box-containing protein
MAARNLAMNGRNEVTCVTGAGASSDELIVEVARTTSVIAALEEGVVVLGRDGAVQICNRGAVRILGLTMGALSTSTALDQLRPAPHDDGAAFSSASHPAMVTLRTGVAQSGVVMGVRRSGGELRWITLSSQPIIEQLGSLPAGVVCTLRDITDERAALDALRRNEALFKAALEGLKSGICVVDELHDNVRHFNERLCEMWDLGALELRLRSGTLRASEFAARGARLLAQSTQQVFVQAGAPASTDDELTLTSGRTLRRVSRCLRGEAGVYFGRMHSFEDVTERVRAEEERRTFERRMQEVQRLESLIKK